MPSLLQETYGIPPRSSSFTPLSMTASPPFAHAPSPIRPTPATVSPTASPEYQRRGSHLGPLIKERTRSLGDPQDCNGSAHREIERTVSGPALRAPPSGKETSPVALPSGVALPPPLAKPMRASSDSSLASNSGGATPRKEFGETSTANGDAITPRSLAPATVALPPPLRLAVGASGSGGGGVEAGGAVVENGGGGGGDVGGGGLAVTPQGGGGAVMKSPRCGHTTLQMRIQQLKMLRQNQQAQHALSMSQSDGLGLPHPSLRARVGTALQQSTSTPSPTPPASRTLKRTLSGSNLGAALKKDKALGSSGGSGVSLGSSSSNTINSARNNTSLTNALHLQVSRSSDELVSGEEREKRDRMKRKHQMVTKQNRTMQRAATVAITRPLTASPTNGGSGGGGGGNPIVKTHSLTCLPLPLRVPPSSPLSSSAGERCMSPPPCPSPTSSATIMRRDRLEFPDEEVTHRSSFLLFIFSFLSFLRFIFSFLLFIFSFFPILLCLRFSFFPFFCIIHTTFLRNKRGIIWLKPRKGT